MFGILSKISKMKDLWVNHGFEVLLVLCVGFLIVFALFNWISRKKGTADKFAMSLLGKYDDYGYDDSDYPQYPQQQYPQQQYPQQQYHQQQHPQQQHPQQSTNVYFSNDEGDSAGERECRRVLQELFNQPFNRARPNFLRNPINKKFNLELDCYNENYNLAVEYNGAQHYKFIPYFHKNREAFLNQKYRDELKKRLCNENNVMLIEVPHTVKIKDIKKYLMKKLAEI
jgi:hypothetical protein